MTSCYHNPYQGFKQLNIRPSASLAREFDLMSSPQLEALCPSNLTFIKEHLGAAEVSLSATTSYKPKRLLYVGTDQTATVCLVEDGRALGDQIRYATLSYCWGSAAEAGQQLLLTVDNIQEFRRAIPLERMTAVIQDAVSVCHSLGISYLWVDSLCILQGSSAKSDWEEQSYEMSRIFGNSWLTICAAASSSCTQSFLQHTDRSNIRIQFDLYSQNLAGYEGPFQLRFCKTDGNGMSMMETMLIMQTPLNLDLLASTWRKRGWVYQEIALSPRKLYFGAGMIHFQDQHHVYSENGHSKQARVLYHSSRSNFDYHCPITPDLIRSQHPFTLDVWYSVAEANANLELTNKLDVFPAISGIARMFAEVTSYQYVAGLWTEDLHRGLLWSSGSFKFGPRQDRSASLPQLLRAIRASLRVAPSWSWASKRDFSFFMIGSGFTTCRHLTHLKPRIAIENADVKVDGANPYGCIKTASITLRGNVFTLPASSMPPTGATLRTRFGRNWRYMTLWDCRFNDSWTVYIDPGWEAYSQTATGLHPRLQKQLRLLPIADCCADPDHLSAGECSGCGRTLDGKGERRTGLDDGAEETPCNTCRHPAAVQEQGIYKKSYLNTLFQDRDPGFVADRDCPECADKSLPRDVWGLLIFPTGHGNEYYRVGAFMSRAEHGGTDIFRDAEETTITLV